MIIAVLKELEPAETRAALVPADAQRLRTLGAQVRVESGLGECSGFPDERYAEAGAEVAQDPAKILSDAELVLGIHPPAPARIALLKAGSVHVSFLEPFQDGERLEQLAAQGVSALALELLPRNTRAQPMDALSSQASLAGYVAVVLAAQYLRQVLPMMTTAAGTIPPARVFVIGAGVAGLQAIATAHRLGATVQAFDVRPQVAEEIQSLGARAVHVELGETITTPRSDGYAAPLTAKQTDQLRDGLARFCAEAEVVVTTAQVPGQRAPVLLTRETLARLRPGSVVVDLAVESGGNVAEVPANAISTVGGVTVITWKQLASRVPATASTLFSANVTSLVEECWNPKTKSLALRLEDPLIQATLVTHAGRVCRRAPSPARPLP